MVTDARECWSEAGMEWLLSVGTLYLKQMFKFAVHIYN
jgi:hypothetical protein